MFAKSIVLSDAFLDMPMSARCLYFTLGMLADDEGFVGNPKSIMRQCGASQDDMLVLLQKRYLLSFESGVIVIKHWRMNNYLRNDRFTKTTYVEERQTLTIDEKGAYTEAEKLLGIPGGRQVVNTDKNSIDKNSIDKNINNKGTKFVPPTLEEVTAYCKERKNSVDPETFVDFYESKGWLIGKNKMKDWKAAVRTWERKDRNAGSTSESESKYRKELRQSIVGLDFE